MTHNTQDLEQDPKHHSKNQPQKTVNPVPRLNHLRRIVIAVYHLLIMVIQKMTNNVNALPVIKRQFD